MAAGFERIYHKEVAKLQEAICDTKKHASATFTNVEFPSAGTYRSFWLDVQSGATPTDNDVAALGKGGIVITMAGRRDTRDVDEDTYTHVHRIQYDSIVMQARVNTKPQRARFDQAMRALQRYASKCEVHTIREITK